MMLRLIEMVNYSFFVLLLISGGIELFLLSCHYLQKSCLVAATVTMTTYTKGIFHVDPGKKQNKEQEKQQQRQPNSAVQWQ